MLLHKPQRNNDGLQRPPPAAREAPTPNHRPGRALPSKSAASAIQIDRLCVSLPGDHPQHKPPPIPTCYIVVMDIATPLKPVWIVHDAFTRDSNGLLPPEPLWAGSNFAFVGQRHFDMVPLLGNVADWGRLADLEDEKEEEGQETSGRGGLEARVAPRGCTARPVLSLAYSGRVLKAAKKARATMAIAAVGSRLVRLIECEDFD